MTCGKPCNCPSYREHCLSISVSAHAMPSRTSSREAVRIDKTEAQWSKDGDAFRRLRGQGYAPADVDGCAELEKRAVDPMEIERGKLLGKTGVRLRKEAAESLTESGVLSETAG